MGYQMIPGPAFSWESQARTVQLHFDGLCQKQPARLCLGRS
jgi:hypothetical protein